VNGLFAKSLNDMRRSFIGWAIALIGVAAMYAAFYPSVRNSAAALNRYLQNLPEAVRSVIGGDYTSPAGYLRSETFSSLGLILLLVWAIGAGGRAIAGEEESGTLDLLMSVPVTRRRVLLDKFASILVVAACLSVALFLTLELLGPPFELVVPAAHLAAACFMLWLLASSFAAIALAAGSATGRRAWADAVAGGLAVATYVLNAIAPSVNALKVLRPLSPFRWYLEPDPLVHGVNLAGVGVLVGITVAGVGAALLMFERRDLAA
jgi:ABC-2 type transport system permease protein